MNSTLECVLRGVAASSFRQKTALQPQAVVAALQKPRARHLVVLLRLLWFPLDDVAAVVAETCRAPSGFRCRS